MKEKVDVRITTGCLAIAQAINKAMVIINEQGAVVENTNTSHESVQTIINHFSLKSIHQLLPDEVSKKNYEAFKASDDCCLLMKDCYRNNQRFDLVLLKAYEEAIHNIVVFILPNPSNNTVDNLQAKYDYLLSEINLANDFSKLVGRDEKFLATLSAILKVADTDSTVFITGEMGTGKALLAQAVYSLSNRKQSPLFRVNCAGISASALESELFGIQQFDDTDAMPKIGKAELAHNGTLLLEEVGEIPPEVQPKLVRLLQEGVFERVGGIQSIEADIRVVATSSQNLYQLVEQQQFRKDLFYLLHVFPIESVPLRDRRADIPELLHHFKDKYAEKFGKSIRRIVNKAVKELQLYDFPGNVRELENLVERAVILTEGDTLNLEAVIPNFNTVIDEDGNLTEFLSFEEMQRNHIITALEKAKWRVSGQYSASELLQVNPKTLVSKMRKLNIKRENFVH